MDIGPRGIIQVGPRKRLPSAYLSMICRSIRRESRKILISSY